MLLLLSLGSRLLLLESLLLLLVLGLLLRTVTELLSVLLELDGVPFHRGEERSRREVVRVVHRHVDAARKSGCCTGVDTSGQHKRKIKQRRSKLTRLLGGGGLSLLLHLLHRFVNGKVPQPLLAALKVGKLRRLA